MALTIWSNMSLEEIVHEARRNRSPENVECVLDLIEGGIDSTSGESPYVIIPYEQYSYMEYQLERMESDLKHAETLIEGRNELLEVAESALERLQTHVDALSAAAEGAEEAVRDIQLEIRRTVEGA